MIKHLRELKKLLRAEGVTVEDVTQGREKACIHFRSAAGASLRYFTGMTPSDNRATIKATRDIVRMAREGATT